LNGDGTRLGDTVGDGRHDYPVAVKRSIQIAVGLIAHYRIAKKVGDSRARHDDFSVGLDGDRISAFLISGDDGRFFTAAAERRVRASVRIVTRDG
jgi:hypothetical protein